MIARVIPLTRLPARFSFFDYLVPEGTTVHIGDLVSVPFRTVTLTGIVHSITKESAQKKLVHLHEVLERGRINESDIRRAEHLARIIGQSSASLLHAALPKYHAHPPRLPLHQATQSISLSPRELPLLQQLVAHTQEQQTCALQGDSESGIALTHIFAKHLKKEEQLLILVPRDRDAHIVADIIPHAQLATLTGTTKESERNAIFHAWKTGTLNILIGTKQVALWSAPNLVRIVVLYAGNDEYAHTRRNPKFDPREAAKLLAQEKQAAYMSIDTLPRIEDCGEGNWLTQEDYQAPQFISLKDRTEKTPHPLITASLIEAIKTASQSQKKVLLFLNRKGAAKRLQCTACDHVPLCGTCGNLPTVRAHDLICDRCSTEMWVPETCPLCNKPKLKFVGVGGDKVVADLQSLFPNLVIGMVEKKNDHAWKTAQVVVATEHVFANLIMPFTRYGFGLVANLMADLPVNGVDFRATEHTARQLTRLVMFARREHATCLVQTWIPERLPELSASAHTVREELRIRHAYKLPPYGTIYHTKTAIQRNPLSPPQEPFTYDGTYLI